MTQARRDVLRGVQIDRTTHAGLWLDTYLTYQTTDGRDSDEVKAARTSLIAEVARNTAPDGYGDASEKRAVSLLSPQKGTVRDVRIYRTDGRTIVGLGQKGVIEAGITLERTWGVPILPGSSLKGVAAATAHLLTDHDSWRKPADKESKPGESFAELFGTTENQGRVIFHDAWWLPDSGGQKPLAQDIMTVHHPNYYQKEENDREFNVPDGTDSPNPISFITTSSGLAFVFCLEAKEADKDWLDAAWRLLDKGLQELGVGAKTNSGYGRLIRDQELEKSILLSIEAKMKEDAAREAFRIGGSNAHFKALLGDLTIRDYGRFYEVLREYQEGDPYELFGSSKYAALFPDPRPEGAHTAFLRALKVHPVFGPALLKGKQIPDLNVGGAKLKELGEKLGLAAIVDDEPEDLSVAFDELVNKARVAGDWADAANEALERSAPKDILAKIAEQGERFLKKKKIKGAEKIALLRQVQTAKE